MSVTSPGVTPPGVFFQLSDLGLPTSQAQFAALFLQAMQQQWPAYDPEAAAPDYVQAQIFASWAAFVAQLCTQGGSELFRQFLTKMVGLQYQAGIPAQTVLEITATDTNGPYILSAGAQVALTLGSVQVPFQTVAPLLIPAGQQTGTVTAVATQSGVAFNGATNPAGLLAQTDWVSTVTAITPAADGVDQMDDDAFQQLGAQLLQLMALRPITAANFATLSLNFTPAPNTDQQLVGRATAIDGYDPTSGTYGNEREVTVCVTDPNGVALNTDTMTALEQWLVSLRETGFIVNVVAPNYTPVYVAVTVVAAPGWSQTAVQASVQAALLSYLTPANFGLPADQTVGWQNTTSVYLSKVEAVIQNAQGVDHIVAGTLAVDVHSTPTNTTQDLALTGPFPLATSSTVSIPASAVTVITQ